MEKQLGEYGELWASPSAGSSSSGLTETSGECPEMKEPSVLRSPAGTESKQRLAVMGLDISLTSPGIVVWDGRRVLAYDNPKTTAAQLDEERTDFILSRIFTLWYVYLPIAVGYESGGYHARQGQDSRAQGVLWCVRYQLWTHEAFTIPITPQQGKKELTGNGNASKERSLEVARAELLPDCPNHDVADALGIAMKTYKVVEEEME